MIGDSLVIQQYVGEETSPAYCRMVPQSDTFTPRRQAASSDHCERETPRYAETVALHAVTGASPRA
jgi:hypothetical protein